MNKLFFVLVVAFSGSIHAMEEVKVVAQVTAVEEAMNHLIDSLLRSVFKRRLTDYKECPTRALKKHILDLYEKTNDKGEYENLVMQYTGQTIQTLRQNEPQKDGLHDVSKYADLGVESIILHYLKKLIDENREENNDPILRLHSKLCSPDCNTEIKRQADEKLVEFYKRNPVLKKLAELLENNFSAEQVDKEVKQITQAAVRDGANFLIKYISGYSLKELPQADGRIDGQADGHTDEQADDQAGKKLQSVRVKSRELGHAGLIFQRKQADFSSLMRGKKEISVPLSYAEVQAMREHIKFILEHGATENGGVDKNEGKEAFDYEVLNALNIFEVAAIIRLADVLEVEDILTLALDKFAAKLLRIDYFDALIFLRSCDFSAKVQNRLSEIFFYFKFERLDERGKRTDISWSKTSVLLKRELLLLSLYTDLKTAYPIQCCKRGSLSHFLTVGQMNAESCIELWDVKTGTAFKRYMVGKPIIESDFCQAPYLSLLTAQGQTLLIDLFANELSALDGEQKRLSDENVEPAIVSEIPLIKTSYIPRGVLSSFLKESKQREIGMSGFSGHAEGPFDDVFKCPVTDRSQTLFHNLRFSADGNHLVMIRDNSLRVWHYFDDRLDYLRRPCSMIQAFQLLYCALRVNKDPNRGEAFALQLLQGIEKGMKAVETFAGGEEIPLAEAVVHPVIRCVDGKQLAIGKRLYDEALGLYQKGQYKEAATLFEKAIYGISSAPWLSSAYFKLGEIYKHGKGVEKDEKKAFAYLESVLRHDSDDK